MKSKYPSEKSHCCKAPMIVTHGCDEDFRYGRQACKCLEEGRIVTSWHECSKCKNPCHWFKEDSPKSLTDLLNLPAKELEKELLPVIKSANKDQKDLVDKSNQKKKLPPCPKNCFKDHTCRRPDVMTPSGSATEKQVKKFNEQLRESIQKRKEGITPKVFIPLVNDCLCLPYPCEKDHRKQVNDAWEKKNGCKCTYEEGVETGIASAKAVIKMLITNEIAAANTEGSPSSRLTSLYNSITDLE